VSALAVAHRRANAVGPVRLRCEDQGLRIDLVQVGRFAAGFAFAGLGDAQSFRVPYTAVRALVREGDALVLAVDPRAAAPYNRFALVRFGREPIPALVRAHRLRSGARLLQRLAPPIVGALAAWLVPARLAGGAVGIGAMAVLLAVATAWAFGRLAAWLTWGGPISDRLREAFEDEVATRLGLEPALQPVAPPLPGAALAPKAPAREGAIEPAAPPAWQALGAAVRPRAFAIVAGLAGAAAMGAVVLLQRYGIADVVLLPVDTVRVGIAARVAPTVAAAVAVATPDHPVCACNHPDSPAWRGGVPQLSMLAQMRRGALPSLWLEPGVTYDVDFGVPNPRDLGVELDLAVVNNGTEPIETVTMVVTFARRAPDGRRSAIRERGLHWPAALRPGDAIKWRVEAEGTELRVDSVYTAKADGLAAAAAIERLLQARLPVVRLHALSLLAYQGDAHLAEKATGLGELAPPEAAARDMLLQTATPLAVCDAERTDAGLDVCVRNATGELHRALRVKDGASGKEWEVRDLFIPGQGLRVMLDGAGAGPFTVEAGSNLRR
jgi:hypothetical protein